MQRRFYANWNMFALTRGRELKFNALQCVGDAINDNRWGRLCGCGKDGADR